MVTLLTGLTHQITLPVTLYWTQSDTVSVSGSPSYWHLPPHPPGHRHLLGGKFRGQIMLSPETFTWDRWLLYSLFTLYTPSLHSAHRSSPESVLILRSLIMFLHNLFSVSGSTQFSCSRGRIMWKWGKCSQSRDITAFGIHPTSNLNMLQLNNNTLDIVMFRLFYSLQTYTLV